MLRAQELKTYQQENYHDHNRKLGQSQNKNYSEEITAA